ncbi:transposase [Candidatus Pacearchaeota archaeon]|nr:transposase [Candidatus Pacearchaeota archaeon]
MSKNDYSKQAERRQKIQNSTLVVGVDIGSKFNAVALMNKDGEVLGTYPKIYNSRKGFNYFIEIIDRAKAKHGIKEVLIGMEPTGHYWRKLAYFADKIILISNKLRRHPLKSCQPLNPIFSLGLSDRF